LGQRFVPRHGKRGHYRGKRDAFGALCGRAGHAGPDNVMNWTASQRRALAQIEKTLAADHPSLEPLFAVFTRLTSCEAMPATERVTARPWRRQRRLWPGAAIVVGLAVATGALLTLSLMLPGPQVCAPGAVTPVAAHARSVSPGRQGACATQQNEPSDTSQSGPSVH
jgi:hypothetical protein